MKSFPKFAFTLRGFQYRNPFPYLKGSGLTPMFVVASAILLLVPVALFAVAGLVAGLLGLAMVAAASGFMVCTNYVQYQLDSGRAVGQDDDDEEED